MNAAPILVGTMEVVLILWTVMSVNVQRHGKENCADQVRYFSEISVVLCFFFFQSNNCTAGKFILRESNFWFCLFTESSHCNGNPCRNGGICTDTGDGFECNCQSGFTGRICQIGKRHDIRPTAGFLPMFLSVVFRCLVILLRWFRNPLFFVPFACRVAF